MLMVGMRCQIINWSIGNCNYWVINEDFVKRRSCLQLTHNKQIAYGLNCIHGSDWSLGSTASAQIYRPLIVTPQVHAQGQTPIVVVITTGSRSNIGGGVIGDGPHEPVIINGKSFKWHSYWAANARQRTRQCETTLMNRLLTALVFFCAVLVGMPSYADATPPPTSMVAG